MGPALHLIARLYAVEEPARTLSLSAEQRLALRQRASARLLDKLHQYLLKLQPEVLPKSLSGAAVRYALNQWEALTRFLEDSELEIDNGATDGLIAISRWAAAELHWFLQAVRCRAVRLVPQRALANPRALHHPAERITSTQLAPGVFPRPSLGNPPIRHIRTAQGCGLRDDDSRGRRLKEPQRYRYAP
jgi:hypothetical protein